MISMELNEHTGADVKWIQELQARGIPDGEIQKIYDNVQRRREGCEYGSV